ncbi:hypothetical protein GPLA_4441 [Paraglaciecola polaris LMG 21857]|uniref:Uncharacterized protein n=1 Tax=Paraglaciecola polaris LMG 21857 TaxID=1129793 RepID=K7AJD5_9ALTE|nr:hypothetical protein GPLA_4441 [Paraglaciecola polaris LMG 21857]
MKYFLAAKKACNRRIFTPNYKPRQAKFNRNLKNNSHLD